MPSRIQVKLQDQIREFFGKLSDEDTRVTRIIGETLIALENVCRAWHTELHNGSFTVCDLQPCQDNNNTLAKIYASIIALRRIGSE